jgi:hypothetical protein
MGDMPFSLRTFSARRLALAAVVGVCLFGLASAWAQPASAGTQSMDLRVSVALAPGSGSTLEYRGTFTGAPLGRGKVDLRTRLGGAGSATVSYTMSTSRGTISGSANVTLAYSGSTVTYKGRASITKGTGAYRRVRSRTLRIAGRAGLTAERVTLSLSGPITS